MLNRCLKAAFPCGLGCFALILTPMILAADLKLETKLLAANVELQRTNKGLSKQLLMQDQQVLKEVAVSVRPTFENRGFSNEDLNAAIVTGWKDYRSNFDSGSPLAVVMVKTSILSLGRIRIESKPSQATIHINTVKYIDLTSTSTWLKPGKYRIKVSKEGFLPAEEEREVQEGDNTPMSLTLTPNPK